MSENTMEVKEAMVQEGQLEIDQMKQYSVVVGIQDIQQIQQIQWDFILTDMEAARLSEYLNLKIKKLAKFNQLVSLMFVARGAESKQPTTIGLMNVCNIQHTIPAMSILED